MPRGHAGQRLLLPLLLFVYSVQSKTITVDWSPNNDLFDNGVHTRTIFVKLNDVLKFKCPIGLSLQIHMMKSALNALECRFDARQSAVGFCSPETTDPRIVIRRISPIPDQPLFQEGEAYYFTAATNDTTGALNDGLCRKVGMRLRVFVLPRDAIGNEQSALDLTRSLWIREQVRAQEVSSAKPAAAAEERSPRRPAPHPARKHASPNAHAKHFDAAPDPPASPPELRYDVNDAKPYGHVQIAEFSRVDSLPNPQANHLPQLDFEIGYEDANAASRAVGLLAVLGTTLLFLLLRTLP